jgi:V/A-type H+/Na+-transporting ATPase subunit E
MKTLEEGSNKIQQICDALKKDAIEPAKKESERILEEAQAKAEQLINDAKKQAEKIHKEEKANIEQERNVFQSFMAQAAKQTLESLRQSIEHQFFNKELQHLIEKEASDPKIVAKMIEAIIKAIEKDGLSADLSALAPAGVSPKEVNMYLAENILQKLKEKSVVLGKFSGGVQIKIHDKKLTLDISDDALIDIFSKYRKGFRELFFQS